MEKAVFKIEVESNKESTDFELVEKKLRHLIEGHQIVACSGFSAVAKDLKFIVTKVVQ